MHLSTEKHNYFIRKAWDKYISTNNIKKSFGVRLINLEYVNSFYNKAVEAEQAWLELREEAIERGLAQYNPKTAKWEWIEQK